MKDLRNHIKQAANQYTEVVDNEALWAGIQQKMGTPKKKRRFLPFLIWGLSLSFLTLVGTMLYNSTDEARSNAVNIDIKTINSVDQEESTTENSTSEMKTSKSEVFPEIPNSNIASNAIKIINNKIVETEKIMPSTSSNQNTRPRTSKNNEAEIYTQNSSNNSLDFFFSKLKPSENRVTNNSEIAQIDLLDINRIIELSKIETSYNPLHFERPTIVLKAEFHPQIPLPSKENKVFSFLNSLTIYTQYGRGSKKIQGDSEYTSQRNESEKFLEQLRFGLESDLLRVLDFTLYGGVSYASINDLVSSDEVYYEDREITYLKSISMFPDGTKKENFETEYLPHLVNKNSARYNSHRLISAPIGMRFGKDLSKIHLGLGFGLDFNYYLSDVHTILGKEKKLTPVPVGGRWLSPSLHAAITADYQIYDKWYLHSKIMYRSTTIENIYLEGDIQENYSLYGIDLGLKFQF